jgi:TetR/AcrR family transcriptional repressor of nem operon
MRGRKPPRAGSSWTARSSSRRETLTRLDAHGRALGCMGVGSVGEFGVADPELVMLRSKVGPKLFRRLAERIREGQAIGEIDPAIDAGEAAAFLQMTMQGIQLGARAGGDAKSLRALARFAINRFRSR